MDLDAVPLACCEPPVHYAFHGVACHRDSWEPGAIVHGPARAVRMCFTIDLGLRYEMDVRRVKSREDISLQADEPGVDDRLARRLGAVLESNFSHHPRAAVVVVEDDPRTDTPFGAFRFRRVVKHLGGDDATEGSAGVEAEIFLIAQAEEAVGPQMRKPPCPTLPIRFRRGRAPITFQHIRVISLARNPVDQSYRIALTPPKLLSVVKVPFFLESATPQGIILVGIRARQANDSFAGQTFFNL